MSNLKEITQLLETVNNQPIEIKRLIYSGLATELTRIKPLKSVPKKVIKQKARATYRHRTTAVLEQKIIDSLKNEGAKTVDDIAKQLNIHKSTSNNRLFRLWKSNPFIKRRDKVEGKDVRIFQYYYDNEKKN